MATLYELLIASHRKPFIFTAPNGKPWHRGNFRKRHWRLAWDGVDADKLSPEKYVPAILPEFMFHEGRHTHPTWLVEDGIPEIARRARPGHKMRASPASMNSHTGHGKTDPRTPQARWHAALKNKNNSAVSSRS